MKHISANNDKPNLHFLEMCLPKLFAFLLPWIIVFAIPKLHFGYYGQIEGQITLMHLFCGILAVNLYIIFCRHDYYLYLLKEPLVYIPFLIALYSFALAFVHRIPNLAMFGSAQLGQGVFWYFDLSILTVLYVIIWSYKSLRVPLVLNILGMIIFVTLFSLVPSLGNYNLSFFHFTDYLCFFGLSFIIVLISVLYKNKFNLKYINYNYIALFLYFLLGPFFLIIKNESAFAFWLLIAFGAMVIEILKKYKSYAFLNYVYKNIYSAKFFVLLIFLTSVCILLSSFIFWDGKNEFGIGKGELTFVKYSASVIARGTIVRILLEHMYSVKAILVGYGWGNTQELLISSFTREAFYQINTGNRVHFHTHNELFEHVLSVGIFGTILYILYNFFILKKAFILAGIFPYLWLLYFLLCTVWFQFINSMPLMALATATLIKQGDYENVKNSIKTNNAKFISLSIIFGTIFIFLLGGGTISALTNKNTEQWGADAIIALATNSKPGECSSSISDYGRGQHYLAQNLNRYTQYLKVQIDLGKKIVETDVMVMKWYLCAADEVINSGKATIELINQDINTISYLSIDKASSHIKEDVGYELEDFRSNYFSIWEQRLRMLLDLAPKRSDQFTPYIAILLDMNQKSRIKNICLFIREKGYEQPYCDLAEAAIYIEEGAFDKAVKLIEDAEKRGAFEKKISLREGVVGADEDLVKILREFVRTHKETNN